MKKLIYLLIPVILLFSAACDMGIESPYLEIIQEQIEEDVEAADQDTAVTVIFDSNGGSAVTTQNLTAGDLVTEPADPVRTGYTFDGWYSDTSLTLAWDFEDDTVTGNMTLYAKWIAITYTVTFNSNGGSAVPEQQVAYGGTASIPDPAPTKAGYAFIGWYEDAELQFAWNFTTDTITGAKTLYAKWSSVGGADITISDPTSPDFSMSPTSFTLQTGGGTTSQTVSVSAGAGFTITEYQWYINGTARGNDQDSIDLDTAATPTWFVTGVNTLTLVVVIDGMPYSDDFFFDVEQY